MFTRYIISRSLLKVLSKKITTALHRLVLMPSQVKFSHYSVGSFNYCYTLA